MSHVLNLELPQLPEQCLHPLHIGLLPQQQCVHPVPNQLRYLPGPEHMLELLVRLLSEQRHLYKLQCELLILYKFLELLILQCWVLPGCIQLHMPAL